MKTTIDLPADIVRAMKIKAARENRKLKEVAADLLRAGLKPSARMAGSAKGGNLVFDRHPKTGHPVIRVNLDPSRAELSVEETYRLIQETQSTEDLERLGYSL